MKTYTMKERKAMDKKNPLLDTTYATIIGKEKIRLLSKKQAKQVISQVEKNCSDIEIAKKIREIAWLYGASVFGVATCILGTPKETSEMILQAEWSLKGSILPCKVKLTVAMKGLLHFLDMINKNVGIPQGGRY